MKKWLSMLLSVPITLSLLIPGVLAVQIPSELETCCTQEEWAVLKQTNRERLAQGLTPYSTFSLLQQAADAREKDLIKSYSHSRPNGDQWHTTLSDVGLTYRAAGENIAAGQTSAVRVVDAWMGSEDHKKNILSAGYAHMGVGYAADGFLGTSWVQLFLNSSCSVSGITLSQKATACGIGTNLDDLDLYIKATCPVHGDCYLPVLSSMCSGFDSSRRGNQTVTVTYGEHTQTLQIQVGSSVPDTSSASDWAVNWISEADELGLLSELNRAGFDANVTRLQFADLSVRLAEQLTGMQITPAPANSFTDTSEEIVLKAKAAGITAGYQNESSGLYEFRPGSNISRQEICVMLTHVVEYVEAQRGALSALDRNESIAGSFPDRGDVANWAVKQVALMTNNDIMSGKATSSGASTISPDASTTLEEAVTLAVKLYRKIKD